MDILDILQLKIGEHMDISVENGRVYRSTLEDVEDGRFLLLSTPLYRGIPVILHRGQEVGLGYIRGNGRIMVSARVSGFRTEGNVRLIIFEPYGRPVRTQLRNAYRLAVRLPCTVRGSQAGPFPLYHTPEDDEEEEQVTTVDVSETGLCFKTQTKYERGERLYLRLYLQWPQEDAPPVELDCRVRRRNLHDPDQGIYQVGVEYSGLDHDTRKHLSRFVLVRQQERRKQQLLVEGE